MILSKDIQGDIESHFYGYRTERLELERLKMEIAEGADFSIEPTGVRGGNISNPTHNKAMRIEKETKLLQQWINVVESTINKFRHTPHIQLMTMTYTESVTTGKVCEDLFIDKSTYSRWREDILSYAAMKACEFGLISV